MSERDGFQPGVPSWIDVVGPDATRLADFYAALFGWELVGPGPKSGGPPGEYYVARLRGRDVAGIASAPEGTRPSAWMTYIEVESTDATVDAIEQAGGSVPMAPFDALPAGRIAAVADPAGAAFCVWEPRERRGAQVVNEPGAWSMSALATADHAAAERFYAEVFGWEVERFGDDGEVGLCRLPGFVGGVPEQPVPRDVVAVLVPAQPGPDGEPAPATWGVDLWVDDLERVVTVATERRGRVVVPPYAAGPFRQAKLADPNGAVFSVSCLTRDPD